MAICLICGDDIDIELDDEENEEFICDDCSEEFEDENEDTEY